MGDLELTFATKFYKIRAPKFTLDEAKARDTTYSVAIYVVAVLTHSDGIEPAKSEIYLGDIPLMTNDGTFLVNGIERIIINQLVRSPGIYFKSELDRQGSRHYLASLISNRGTWIKFEIDKEDLIFIKIDKAKKISAYVFLKALGLKDADIKNSIENFEYFRKTVLEYQQITLEESFLEIHSKLRPGEPATVKGAQQLLFLDFSIQKDMILAM